MKRIVCFVIALFMYQHSAAAQGFGHDMWTQQMSSLNLFTPHVDNCESTEVFVQMGGGSGLGYCIEKDQRSAAYFQDARQTCLSLGKRLPEPMEFKYACDNPPSGLVNMTNDWEWASNFLVHHYGNPSVSCSLVGFNMDVAVIAGNGGCAYTGSSQGTDGAGSQYTATYRCVH